MAVITLSEHREVRTDLEAIRGRMARSRGYVVCLHEQDGRHTVHVGGVYRHAPTDVSKAMLLMILELSKGQR